MITSAVQVEAGGLALGSVLVLVGYLRSIAQRLQRSR
jgi:hypothetical protein